MRINTRTGKIELLKRERETLTDCKSLLLQIAKHGDEKISDDADTCADLVGGISRYMDGGEIQKDAKLPLVAGEKDA